MSILVALNLLLCILNIHMSKKQATILQAKHISEQEKELPQSWVQAKGVLNGTDIDPIQEQNKQRGEWEDRLKELDTLHTS